mgnify:CR=1 FL=1
MGKTRYRNRYTSKTGYSANLTRQVKRVLEQVDSMKQEVKRLRNIISELNQQIEILKQTSSEFLNMLFSAEDISPILKMYIQILQKNITRNPNGYRYQGLKEFFTLLSFMGPHYYGMLSTNMIFPSYRRTLDYKKYFLDKYQITDDIYNGSIQNVDKIIKTFLPANFDGKLVIMIDAASVTPYVKVIDDGTVEGFIHPVKLKKKVVKQLIENEQAFCNFINENYDSIVQAEFGISIAPLDPDYPSFPIACLQATSGKATLEIVTFIETLIAQLRSSYNIIGLGTDGDNSYHKYSSMFITKLIAGFKDCMNMSIIEIVRIIDVLMHFSDPFHLVKRDRYRKVTAYAFCISPLVLECTRNAKHLLDIGVPEYILDNNKGRKMEDDLPKKLFSLVYIQKIIEKGDFNLLISMLPSALLMASIHTKNLSRQATVDYLLLGASIVIIYYCLSNYVLTSQDESLQKKINEYQTKICFSSDWCEEYIFTTICIAFLITTEKSINVGACGSHYQEHSFANVRRHSKNDNSHSRFIKSMRYILLEKILYNNLPIDEVIPYSRSDSGRKICDNERVVVRSLGFYLSQAKRLWSNVTSFPKDCIVSQIEQNGGPMSIPELLAFFGGFSCKVTHSISTKSTGMIKTGGLNNAKIWNAIEQMENLLEDNSS